MPGANHRKTDYHLPARIFFSALFLFLFNLQNIPAEAADKGYETEIRKLIDNGGCTVSKRNRTILSLNTGEKFIPASIWKIVTSLAAFETLGEQYRFKTELYLDSKNNLYIRGFGDPFLISEEIDNIFKELSGRGITEIKNIYLDTASFSLSGPPPGVSSSLNPYDVINGALAVNFNTINFYVDEKGVVSSAERQTPTLGIMKELGRNFRKGKHRINISGSSENMLRNTGELFRAIQKQNELPGSGTESEKKVPENLSPVYVHYSSKKLTDIIKAMMLYSNNYIANQIFLTMGAYEYGYPATWDKGRKYLAGYLDKNFGKYSNDIKVSEGSGISRENRITIDALTEVLERYKPYINTLPVDNGACIKSGTLNGVYSYAGYLKNKNDYDSFVIILNQKKNNRDRVLKLLKKAYSIIP